MRQFAFLAVLAVFVSAGSKALSQSTELKSKAELAKKLIEKARSEFKKQNYDKSKSFADSASMKVLFSAQELYDATEAFFRPPETRNPVIQDAWKTYKAATYLSIESSEALQEISFDAAHWFRYGKGTFERQVEFDILRWYRYSTPDERGASFDYGFLGRGRKRIIKSIGFSNGTLTVNIRCDPIDILDMSKEFKHPGMFMGHFRRLTYQIWNTGKYASSWERNRYKEVNEVVFTLYYPGKDFGTETPIAKFGLSRSVGESVKWRGISSKDGTFQDLMKEKGTYWLHPQVPDMGTPTALIKRQTP